MNPFTGASPKASAVLKVGRVVLYWVVLGIIAIVVWDRVAVAWTVAIAHNAGMVMIAVTASLISTISFALAWRYHIGLRDGRLVAADYLTSNVAKYLPLGSAVQYARQSYRVRTRGGTVRDGAIGSLRFIFTVVGIGGGTTAVLSAVLGRWLVVASSLLLVPLIALRVQDRLLSIVPWTRRVEPPGRYSPRRGWVLVWLVLGVITFGLSFALLTMATDVEGLNFLQLINTGIASWLAGYVVVPVPSGVGVREAVVGFLTRPLPGEAFVAATLLHRGVGAIGDVLALVLVPIFHWTQLPSEREAE